MMWNTQHVRFEPLTQGEGMRLRELIEATGSGGRQRLAR